jgi:hypothetical protein
MRLWYLFMACLCAGPVRSQVFMRPFDNAAALALGSATVAYPGVASGLANDALPATGERLGVLAGSAVPYGLGGWLTGQVQAFGRIDASSGLGLDLAYSGLEQYGEQRFRLLYARRLGRIFYLGGSAELLRVNAAEYGSGQAVTFGLSMLAQALPKLWIGARIFNPQEQKLAGVPLPGVLRLGACWKPSVIFLLLAETEKDLDKPAQVKAGAEYRPAGPLVLRLGVRSTPARMGFGAGLVLKNGLTLDVGSDWHPVLGFTPAAMVAWRKS